MEGRELLSKKCKSVTYLLLGRDRLGFERLNLSFMPDLCRSSRDPKGLQLLAQGLLPCNGIMCCSQDEILILRNVLLPPRTQHLPCPRA